MRATAASASAMLAVLHGFVDEYLAEGGPLDMLEGRTPSREFQGREMHPEQLHSVAMALDVTTQLLRMVEEFFAGQQRRWTTGRVQQQPNSHQQPAHGWRGSRPTGMSAKGSRSRSFFDRLRTTDLTVMLHG